MTMENLKKVNLTKTVTVVLTYFGKNVLTRYCQLNKITYVKKNYNEATSELTVPLYELFNIFGSYFMYDGCPKIFENNDIIIN